MNKNRWWARVRALSVYGVFLYAGIAVFAYMIVDWSRMSAHAGPATLSRLRPSYGWMGDFFEDRVSFDRRYFEEMAMYLKNVDLVMKERPDVDLFLGYCFYYLNDRRRAEDYYSRALQRSSDFFWAYHGMAVMSAVRGDREQSRRCLIAAANMPSDVVMQAVLASRVFLPFLSEAGYTPEKIFSRYIEGRLEVDELLCAAALKDGDFSLVIETAGDGLKIAHEDARRVNFMYFLGAAFARKGEIQSAIRLLQECLKIRADHPEALFEMAKILKELGQVQVADSFSGRADLVMKEKGGALLDVRKVSIRAF